MDFSTCKVNWDAQAKLRDMNLPTRGAEWVGDPLPGVTVAGAISTFRKLPRDVQERAEMGIDRGVIEGCTQDFLGYDVLSVLARRSDVPQ
jgi:hypothetical protein